MLSTEVGETGKIYEQYIYVFLPPMQFQRTLKNGKSREERKQVLLKNLKKCAKSLLFLYAKIGWKMKKSRKSEFSEYSDNYVQKRGWEAL